MCPDRRPLPQAPLCSVPFRTVPYRTVQYLTILTFSYCTISCGTVSYGTISYGTISYGTISYGTIRPSRTSVRYFILILPHSHTLNASLLIFFLPHSEKYRYRTTIHLERCCFPLKLAERNPKLNQGIGLTARKLLSQTGDRSRGGLLV
jgi:hypothetical protein